MIPTSLNQWNEEVIVDLLKKSYYETEYFDFKETLPHRSDPSGKLRLRQACCAFANSIGGFLVFGIIDDTASSPEARLVGIEPNLDFPEHFGNFPKECSPSMDWAFKNPPITLSSGRVLHVCHIPKSWNMPHAFREADGSWRFYKRTNKGNEPMSVEEIRMAFVGYYEKRLKLQLLHAELQQIVAHVYLMFIPDEELEKRPSIDRFELYVLETVFSDVYTIIVQETEITEAIQHIRSTCRAVNHMVDRFLSKHNYHLTALTIQEATRLYKEHNLKVRLLGGQIEEYCSNAMARLKHIIEA